MARPTELDPLDPTMVLSQSLVSAALAAAGEGWRVFPLAPGRKVPRRQLTDWESKATSDPERIKRWWAGHPVDNVGIAAGPSGLVVVDLDTAKPGDKPATSGVEALQALADQAGERLPRTWSVATPSGGRHLYYGAPAGRALRNTAGRLAPRIDTRAQGGYVVGAGSMVDGRRYRARVDDVALLPGWLTERLDPPSPTVRSPCPVPRTRGYVETVLTDEVQRILDAPYGTRNNTLNIAAWNLARLIAQGVLPRHVIEQAMQATGEAVGLRSSEVAATVQSAINARLRRPGGAR